ncbi:phage portal protein [Microbacterium maritypicum]
MAEPLTEAIRLARLLSAQKKPLEKNDNYFEGEQPLRFIAPILEKELGYRLSPIVINLALFATDVYEHRLDIEGFRLRSSSQADNDLDSAWQINDGPFLSQQLHRESLALGRGYATVGPGETSSDSPILTIESPFDAIHQDDPRTKRVQHGIKRWTDSDKTRWMTFHHQNGWVTWYRKGSEWIQDAHDDNEYNLCSLVPLMNDPRILGRVRPNKSDQRLGRSVFHPIISPLDSLNKIASDMMVSAEFHALPRRWATGLDEKDFVDEQTGQALDTFSMIAGRMWGTAKDKAKFGQFQEANLENFHNTIKLLMQVIHMQLGIPGTYLLFQGDNPPSADAIRASEAQLVKRAERKQTVLGAKWEQVQRLMLLNMGDREASERPEQIETIWRDPSTPTIAQKADAIVKLVGAKDSTGRSIVPIEQARKDLGYTEIEQGHMRDWDENTLTDPQLDAARKDLRDAAGGR